MSVIDVEPAGVDHYQKNGYLLVKGLFSPAETESLASYFMVRDSRSFAASCDVLSEYDPTNPTKPTRRMQIAFIEPHYGADW